MINQNIHCINQNKSLVLFTGTKISKTSSIVFYDVEQNTDTWMDLRAPLITSSSMAKVMANYGKAFESPAKKYAVNVAIGQITGVAVSSEYNNSHMERGHEEEPIARMLYEEQEFCTVKDGGFFADGDTGTSPDGLVGDDGLIEIKSVVPSTHFANIKRQSFDPSYKWQIISHLKISGRDWIDFISYCSAFPIERQLYRCRLQKEQFLNEFEMIDERLDKFRALIEKTKELIFDDSKYSVGM